MPLSSVCNLHYQLTCCRRRCRRSCRSWLRRGPETRAAATSLSAQGRSPPPQSQGCQGRSSSHRTLCRVNVNSSVHHCQVRNVRVVAAIMGYPAVYIFITPPTSQECQGHSSSHRTPWSKFKCVNPLSPRQECQGRSNSRRTLCSKFKCISPPPQSQECQGRSSSHRTPCSKFKCVNPLSPSQECQGRSSISRKPCSINVHQSTTIKSGMSGS